MPNNFITQAFISLKALESDKQNDYGDNAASEHAL